MDNRRLNIEQACPDTGSWLFSSVEYSCWIRRENVSSHNGFLWIKAKPGAGKSTLMKRILQDLQTSTKPQHAVAAYFFHARGASALEKSQLGMVRTLLHQLVDKLPSLLKHFGQLYASKEEKHGKYGADWTWHFTELQDLLTTAILHSKGLQFSILVDALDECREDDVRDVAVYFESLCHMAVQSEISLNVLFASRHYPHVSVEKSLDINLDERAGHMMDIAKYVQKTLKRKDDTALVSAITQRSAGIFLWTQLVVRRLNQAYDDGQEHKLHQIIQTIPIGLDALFAEILHYAVDPESVLILQWILFKERDLAAVELYWGVIAGTNSDALRADYGASRTDASVMERFILSSSRGLLHCE